MATATIEKPAKLDTAKKNKTKAYRFISSAGIFILPLPRDKESNQLMNPYSYEFGSKEINGGSMLMAEKFVYEDDVFPEKYGPHLAGKNVLEWLFAHPEYAGKISKKNQKYMNITKFYLDESHDNEVEEEIKSTKLEGKVKDLEKQLTAANKEIAALKRKEGE